MKFKTGDIVHVGTDSKVEWKIVETKDYLVRLQENDTDYAPHWLDVSLVRGKKN